MSAHHGTAGLTRNQALVFDALTNAGSPLSAYTILDLLRAKGLRAPLQVYRALDKLVEYGMVHRLESLNAFVACRHPGSGTHETMAFAICEKCGRVSELTDPELENQLRDLVDHIDFTMNKSVIEFRGCCHDCRPN